MQETTPERGPEPAHELALRYLLELSTDVRAALLVDAAGDVIAAAPDAPSEEAARATSELARRARELAGPGRRSIELDVTVESGTVFLVSEEGSPALVCVTGRLALPGLVLHDMRTVLNDIRKGGVVRAAR
jgi:hypothetical protein